MDKIYKLTVTVVGLPPRKREHIRKSENLVTAAELKLKTNREGKGPWELLYDKVRYARHLVSRLGILIKASGLT